VFIEYRLSVIPENTGITLSTTLCRGCFDMHYTATAELLQSKKFMIRESKKGTALITLRYKI
jgi:hypothetical protein